MHSDLLLVLVVGTALAFDFTNGFHDTANVVATSISTRALPPRVAIGMASLLNFAGAFISLAVAATVAKGIVDPSVVALQPAIVFSGLIGAISWNVVTWYYGLPSSSSHALIGGVVGAAFAANGSSGVMGDGLVGKVVVPAIVAPILAFLVAGFGILVCYRIVGRLRPGPVGAGFRFGQVSIDLVEKRGLDRFKARVRASRFSSATVVPGSTGISTWSQTSVTMTRTANRSAAAVTRPPRPPRAAASTGSGPRPGRRTASTRAPAFSQRRPSRR